MLAQTGLFIWRKFTECLSANTYGVAASEMDLNILQLFTDIAAAAALQQAQSGQVGLQAYQQGLLGSVSESISQTASGEDLIEQECSNSRGNSTS